MIIEHFKNTDKYQDIVNNYDIFVPDQFVSEKEKNSPDWVKSTLDYYATIAHSQYWNNEKIKKNYDLLNGILHRDDYFTEDYERLVEFLDESTSVELPDYVKHYPMMNPPINTLVGEIIQRPDNARFKAVDEYSFNEFIRAKNELLNTIFLQKLEDIMLTKAKQLGLTDQKEQLQQQMKDIASQLSQSEQSQEEVTPETSQELQDLQKQAEEIGKQIEELNKQIQDLKPKDLEKVTNKTYQSTAEQWANLKLEQLKRHFNIKDKSQEGFLDFLTSAREFHHIYVNSSKLGIGYDVVNPRNVFFLTEPNPRYTTDCYVIGRIESMELSRILERFNLTMDEIEYLREHRDDYIRNPSADINIFENSQTGYDSVHYSTYNPARLNKEIQIRGELEQEQLLDTYDPAGNRYSPDGYLGYETRNQRYTVIVSYFKSKRKIGKVNFIDDDGFEQLEIVDENFEYDKKDPRVKVEWEYVNEWWEGIRIGRAVYKVSPLRHLELPPMLGTFYRAKNTIPKSIVDHMKVYQIIYNICLNQLYLLLEKEVGVAVLLNLRQLPKYKDMTDENALEKTVTLMKEMGIVPLDDSPENMKGQSSFNQSAKLDLTRTQEIQSRISLASWAKQQCWELLGFTPQRLGAVQGIDTATGIQQGMAQSFAQTEPITSAHEECMNLVYQQLIDTAQYIETQKPTSTISYVDHELHDVFLQVNTEDLKMRDLQIFVSNRSEDKRKLEEIRQLSMAYAQNQLHPYYTTLINTSQSISDIREFLKDDMQKKEKQQAEQQQVQQQQMQQQQQIAEQQQQTMKQIADDKLAFEKEEANLNRERDVLVARIKAGLDNPTPADSQETNNKYSAMLGDLDIRGRELEERRSVLENQKSLKLKELELKAREIEAKREADIIKSQTALKNPVSGEKK
jgi:seryl-tRNA synthetase